MFSWLHRFAGVSIAAGLCLWATLSVGQEQAAEAACRDETDPQAVIDACSEVIDPYGKPVWALVRRGHAYLDFGRIEEGRADASLAVRAAARNSDAHALLGRALRDASEYDAALKSLTRALSLDPDNAAAYYYRAQLHYWRDETEEALDDIGQAVAIDGGSLDFRYWRGVIADEGGDRDTALADFSWVIGLDPQNPEYLDSRAWTYYTLGRFPEALADIDRALSIDPYMATPHETRGHIMFASNRSREAEKDLRRALERDPERTLARQLLSWMNISAPLKPRPTACGPLAAQARKLASLAMTIEPGSRRAGEPMSLKWKFPDLFLRADQPTYLVAVTPDDVRFGGRGFLALAPGARGPYGIAFGEDRSRAIVPLHTEGAQRSGEIEIVPYRAGASAIAWQVVQISECGETSVLSSEGRFDIEILPGVPQLISQEEGTGEGSRSEVRSLSGRFAAIETAGAVHAIEAESGAAIVTIAGRNPVFSPTGRFLTVEASEGAVDIYDLVAVRKLGRFGSGRMYWSHADSFLYLDRPDARIHILRTLHGDRYAPTAPSSVDAPASVDDIMTPAGAEGAIDGSMAWTFELSVEGGVVAFANSFLENAGMIAEDGSGDSAADLGAAAFHPDPDDLDLSDHGVIASLVDPGRTRRPLDKDELPVRLAYGYGIEKAAVVGWNNHDVLWLGRRGGGATSHADGPVRPVLLATQQSKSGVDRDAGSGASDFSVRAPRPFSRPEDNELAAGAVSAIQFGHLPGERLVTLRGGRDQRWIDPMMRAINEAFPTSVAYFERDETGEQPLQAIPDPYPLWLPDDVGSIDLDKPGRDLWSGASERERFWLAQTALVSDAEGRFAFSLLSTGADGLMRYSDLLPLANMWVARREHRPLTSEFDIRATEDMVEGWGEGSSVTLAGGRYLTIVTRPSPRILVFDLQDWTLVCAISRPRNPGNIGDAAFHADLRHVTQINRSGELEVYDCRDGGHVLTALYRDGEIVVVDKGGHYDGSQEAAATVAVRVPGVPGRHLLAQFANRLRVPGLAGRVLSGDGPSASGAFDPPTLRVSPGIRGGGIGFSARSSAGLASIEVFADGLPLTRLDGNGDPTLEIAAADISNRGIVTAVATDRDGVTSVPVEILPTPVAEDRSAGLYVLAVGIDTYRGIEGVNLRYSAADATRLVKSINRSTLYSTLSLSTLTDDSATASAIIEHLTGIVQMAGPDDTIVLSLAGNAVRSENGSIHLLLSDARLDDLAVGSLDLKAIGSALSQARARIVILLDVSHGKLAGRAAIATNEDAFADISAGGAPMVVISAASGAQFSEQTTTISGGRLSVAIRDILIKERDGVDTDGNGNISVNEMARAAMSMVAHGSEGRQTPWVARRGIAGDFEIF
ncbi:MAG: tetratricopeptide repeat protein [Rhizobiaceae bacterium]